MIAVRKARQLDDRWRKLAAMMEGPERNLIAAALTDAADQFEKDAISNAGAPRIAAQFIDQAKTCRAIAFAVEL